MTHAMPTEQIPLRDVESSNIKAIGYDPFDRILKVVMKSAPSMIYAYKDVPLHVFQLMEKSDSKGRYFVNEVKGKYEFEKIQSQENS